jgi:ferric-dicitrate binding protein FerR (iron transport regulator)
MTARPRLAELAARALSREDVEAPSPTAQERLFAVNAMQEAMRKKARRRTLVRGGIALGAIAAGILLYAGARHHRVAPTELATTASDGQVFVSGEAVSGEVVAVKGDLQVPLTSGLSLLKGDRVIAERGAEASLELSTGTHLHLEERADFTVVERGPTQIFSLKNGAMRADVAKLRDGQRFIVATPDAEIEVRGTSFRLARVAGDPSCLDGVLTRLTVYEGTVVARGRGREDSVGAGQSWSAGCMLRAVASDLRAPAMDPEPAAKESSAPPAAPAPTPSQALRSMNDLFEQAVAAKRRGDKKAALALFERFESQYPQGALAESAAAERMKVLASMDAPSAAAAARKYLARYPNGFAKSQAEAILAKGP